jgi:hypothetical protein
VPTHGAVSRHCVHVSLLTWQPAACSCGCAVPQGQHAVGTGTQQLPWLGTQSHRRSQSLGPGAWPLLGEGDMSLLSGVTLSLEPSLGPLTSLPHPASGDAPLLSFLSPAPGLGSELRMGVGPTMYPRPRAKSPTSREKVCHLFHLLTTYKYWPFSPYTCTHCK